MITFNSEEKNMTLKKMREEFCEFERIGNHTV